MHAFPTNKNGANESVKCSCSCALCSFTLVSIDVELPFVQHEKRKDYPARTAHALPIHSNERTNSVSHSLPESSCFLGGQISLEGGGQRPVPFPFPLPFPCLHAYLSPSICLSLSLSAQALCSADSHLDRQSGLKFSIPCLSSRNRAELHLSPSKYFLEYI